jgi:hypothetical protein
LLLQKIFAILLTKEIYFTENNDPNALTCISFIGLSLKVLKFKAGMYLFNLDKDLSGTAAAAVAALQTVVEPVPDIRVVRVNVCFKIFFIFIFQ